MRKDLPFGLVGIHQKLMRRAIVVPAITESWVRLEAEAALVHLVASSSVDAGSVPAVTGPSSVG